MAIAMDKLKQGRCVSLLTYIIRVLQVSVLYLTVLCSFGQDSLRRDLPYLVSTVVHMLLVYPRVQCLNM